MASIVHSPIFMKNHDQAPANQPRHAAESHSAHESVLPTAEREVLSFEPPDLGLPLDLPLQKVAGPVSFHPPVVQRKIDLKAFSKAVETIAFSVEYNPGDASVAEMEKYVKANPNKGEDSVLPMFYVLFHIADALDKCFREFNKEATDEEKIQLLEELNNVVGKALSGNVVVGDDQVAIATGNDSLSRYLKMGLNSILDVWTTIEEDGMKNKYAHANLQNSKETYSRRVKFASVHPSTPPLLRMLTRQITVNLEKQATPKETDLVGTLMEMFDADLKAKKTDPLKVDYKDFKNFVDKTLTESPEALDGMDQKKFYVELETIGRMSYDPI